jgi:hypothetical protein
MSLKPTVNAAVIPTCGPTNNAAFESALSKTNYPTN